MKSYHEWKLAEAALDGMQGQSPPTATSMAAPDEAVPGWNAARNASSAKQAMNQSPAMAKLGANLSIGMKQLLMSNPKLARSIVYRLVTGLRDDKGPVSQLKAELLRDINELARI